MHHRFFAFASAALIVAALILPAPVRAEENRRDGNWWRGQSAFAKASYMVGFFDGMELGKDFSYWGLAKTNDIQLDPMSSRVFDAYNNYREKFMKHVTNVQISDGLDTFYDDYRNRAITLPDAVWLVLNTIAGKPDKDMEKMIENFRKNQK